MGMEECLIFILVLAVILFILHPKTNGDFDESYLTKDSDGKEEYWWQEEDRQEKQDRGRGTQKR